MKLGLEGRRAAVAAASSGLGCAIAAALSAEGAHVAICGRDERRIRDAAASLSAHAVPLVADVATVAGATSFVESARDALGGIDILVTNGGGPPPGTFESTPLEEYAPALEKNLTSAVAMVQLCVPAMRAARWGRVIAVTSIAVREPVPNLILSNTARSGLTAFLKTLAREIAADHVTVNSLQPGLHATPRVSVVYGDGLGDQVARIPARTLGSPEDFGNVAAFLCSDHARFITGAAIPVDGGAYCGLM